VTLFSDVPDNVAEFGCEKQY
jgi:hypothetical protein